LLKFFSDTHSDQTLLTFGWLEGGVNLGERDFIMSKEKCLGLSLVFFGLSGGCWIGYHLIGASVNKEGFLVELFALIPLGWFFLLLGLVAGSAYLWISKKS